MAVVLVLAVAFMLCWFVGTAYVAVGARSLLRRRPVEEVTAHPSIAVNEATLVVKLSQLLAGHRSAMPTEAPRTPDAVEQLQRHLYDLRGHLPQVQEACPPGKMAMVWVGLFVRKLGWSLGWAASLRWAAVRWLLCEANELTSRADKLLHQGLLNIADPAASRVELTEELSRPPLEAVVSQVQVGDRVASIDLAAPRSRVPTTIAREKKVRGAVEIVQVPRRQSDINRDYAKQVLDYARRSVHTSFRSVPGLEQAVVTISRSMVHQTRGHGYVGAVLSVAVDRATWNQIVHANVTSENAFKNFAFNFKVDGDFNLLEVPALSRRPGSAEITSSPVVPMDLDPLAFEQLIRDLLRNMGYQAELTKGSHDGGIDIEAFNPQPMVGGKLIVQCKRYRDTVGAPAIRDLFGVVTATNATKGILVTTSSFSPDAIGFAQGKQLELIDGQMLAELLNRYGIAVATREESVALG